MMIRIPGFLVALLTFPGVIWHEIAHRFFCDLMKVPVYDVRYFEISRESSGYVIHGHTDSLAASFLICSGPFIINTILCALITFPACFSFITLGASDHEWPFILCMWIGISIGAHAFPSVQDTKELTRLLKQSKVNFLLLLPLYVWVLVIRVLACCNNAIINFVYALGIASILPSSIEGMWLL